MKLFKLLALLLIWFAFLSGCAPVHDTLNPYEENFRCRAKDDTGECIDTSSAYKKARYPAITEDKVELPAHQLKLQVQESRYKILAELLQETKKPLLQPAKILRVLLLPYRGENNELFMTRYVYLKIEDSKWILTDLGEK